MKYVIDTNIFYYAFGLSHCDLDRQKLIRKIQNTEEVFLSELAILEFYTKYRNDKQIIYNTINQLAEMKLQLLPSLPKEDSLIDKNILLAQRENVEILNVVIDDALRIKTNIERDYLRFWVVSVSALIAANYLASISNITSKYPPNYLILFAGIIETLKCNDSFLSIEIGNALDEFYQNEESVKFKDRITNAILDISEFLFAFFVTGSKGQDLFQLIGETNKSADEVSSILNIYPEIENMEKIIIRRRTGETSIVRGEVKNLLKSNIRKYRDGLDELMKPGESYYAAVLLEKFLTIKNSKIEKNNVIDSIFLKYYPDAVLLTYDKNLLKIIKNLDHSYHQEIVGFLNECK